MSEKQSDVKRIFFYVPNIIGYIRIFLALVSFYVIRTNYIIACGCYILSGFLDAFDGHAARLLNQGTKFGAMLDQLTDRAATACLLVALAHFYPDYMFFFQLSLAIDIVSHWMHLHASLMMGQTSHKNVGLEGNPIMRIYYTSRPVLFVMCSGNELFYSMLYILHFSEGPEVFVGLGVFRLILYLSFPIMVLKTLISIIHLVEASYKIALLDAEERSK